MTSMTKAIRRVDLFYVNKDVARVQVTYGPGVGGNEDDIIILDKRLCVYNGDLTVVQAKPWEVKIMQGILRG